MSSPGSVGLLPHGNDSDIAQTSLGLLSYDTRTDAEPLVLDEVGCAEGCSAFGQSTQVCMLVCRAVSVPTQVLGTAVTLQPLGLRQKMFTGIF